MELFIKDITTIFKCKVMAIFPSIFLEKMDHKYKSSVCFICLSAKAVNSLDDTAFTGFCTKTANANCIKKLNIIDQNLQFILYC